MADQKAIVVGISGCSSSGKTTLARLLRDIFPNTFILHEDDFYKAEDQLPIKDGLVDWDCPEAISFPDMEKALSHIRSTGTFPVSLLAPAPTLSRRHHHGFAQPPGSLSQTGGRRGAAAFVDQTGTPIPLPSLSPSSSNPSSSAATTGLSTPLTSHPTSTSSSSVLPIPQDKPDQALTISAASAKPPKQPDLESKEDQNTIGKCPVTESQIASAKQKVHEWLQPGRPGSLIFPPPTPSKPQSHDDQAQSSQTESLSGPRICLLDGFLLYSPHLLPESLLTTLLDIKLFLLVSKEKATKRREARDGYVTLEGFWTDPPGYVEKIVWPNYVASHKWLFQDGDVEKAVLNQEAMEKYGILAPTGKGMDVPFEETLEWAVESIMGELERIFLHSGKTADGEKEGGR